MSKAITPEQAAEIKNKLFGMHKTPTKSAKEAFSKIHNAKEKSDG